MKNQGAIISDCQRFRYRLWRTWDIEKPVMCFIMLNPSTADCEQDDPTIRKCIGFAKANGFGGIEVVNLFAFRATDPQELKAALYPVGPTNDAAIVNAVQTAMLTWGLVVCAWGAQARGLLRVEQVVELLQFNSVPLYCLRVNRDNTPAHSLMLPYTCELKEWNE